MTPAAPAVLEHAVGSDEELLQAFRDGDLAAATTLYERYARRLLGLARAKSPGFLAGRHDPEDVVQSVFQSFFRGARAGMYYVPDRTDLWPLLLTIALNKIRARGVFHSREQRDARRTESMGDDSSLERAVDRMTSTDSEPFLAVLARDLIDRLPERLRPVVELRLQGYDVATVASELGRTKRSVERLLQECRNRLAELVNEDDPV